MTWARHSTMPASVGWLRHTEPIRKSGEPGYHRPSVARPVTLLLGLALAAGACSADAEPTTSLAPQSPTTVVTTTPPSTVATTTTEPPPTTRPLRGDVPQRLRRAAEAFYNHLIDDTNPAPDMPAGLDAYVADVVIEPGPVQARGSAAKLKNGDRVGVVTTKRDVLLFVDVGEGWRIVGAMLGDRRPWLGKPGKRTLLVIGSDARVGEDQLALRADSVHVLTILPRHGKGAIVGFPRDSWVRGRKLTDLMPQVGADGMVEVIEEMTALDMEGYAAVGFEGFLGLMEELGPLRIDLPTEMRSGNNWDDYPAGPQELSPTLALRLARIRKGLLTGDFERTVNQGRIILAAMQMIQDEGIELLPHWVAAYDRHGFTDLGTEALVTWAATAYLASPESLANIVVPGSNGFVGSASVVFLGDAAEGVYRDLDDGVIDEEH